MAHNPNQPHPSPKRQHGANAAPTRCVNCDNDIETGGCRCALAPATPLEDPRWYSPVGVPTEAFTKAAALASSGAPINHLVNIAIYGVSRGGTRRVKPIDAVSAFEAALTLVLANGQIAAEAMWQAGFPRAEIDDRITRFTNALHQAASTQASPLPCPQSTMGASPASRPEGFVFNPVVTANVAAEVSPVAAPHLSLLQPAARPTTRRRFLISSPAARASTPRRRFPPLCSGLSAVGGSLSAPSPFPHLITPGRA